MAPSIHPVKKRWRSKFFSCFSPVADEDAAACSQSSSPPPSSDDESGRRRKTAHHSLYGSMKAVFFKTTFARKLRSKRSKRDSYRPSSNIPSKCKKLINPITKNKSSCNEEFSVPEEIFADNSDRTSLFSSTSVSCASSISSNSRSGSEKIQESVSSLDVKQNSTNNREHALKRIGSKCSYNYNPATGMYILLVCLVALVFGGKAFAIVTCTSTWLFFAPGHPTQGGGLPENYIVESKEYKKRVIMQGLLERNRPRLL